MNNIVVKVEKLVKKFGNFTAVDHIDFSISKGEIFGFLGPNGAGKSTTIKMLCGLLTPNEGRGTVAGFDIKSQPEQIRKNIGYMSQKFSLYPDLTAEENLNFFAGVYNVDKNILSERKDKITKLAGIEDKRNEITSNLTGGWRQRLALGCALIHMPEIVFLDEPTSGVDPLSRRDFWKIIRALSEMGISILVTTHYMEEAEYCEKLALISQGRLIAKGTPSELKDSFDNIIYFIETDKLMETIDIFSKSKEILETSLWGVGLHIVMKKNDNNELLIKKILENSKILIKKFVKSRPTLEDIFVYKVEEANKE